MSRPASQLYSNIAHRLTNWFANDCPLERVDLYYYFNDEIYDHNGLSMRQILSNKTCHEFVENLRAQPNTILLQILVSAVGINEGVLYVHMIFQGPVKTLLYKTQSSIQAIVAEFLVSQHWPAVLKGKDKFSPLLNPLLREVFGVAQSAHITSVVQMSYEGSNVCGTLSVGSASDCTIKFSPIHISSSKRVRKLLECTRSDEFTLIFDPEIASIVGLGVSSKEYGPKIKFKEHDTWEVYDADTSLICRVKGSTVSIGNTDDDVLAGLAKIIKSFGPDHKEEIEELLKAAKSPSSGTMLVFTPAAEAESVRLATRGTVLTPAARATASVISALASIDGCILIDPKTLLVYAFGVVLDGTVTPHAPGRADRGARYNAAIIYQSNHLDSVLFVVSEDGYCSTVPDDTPLDNNTIVEEEESSGDGGSQDRQANGTRTDLGLLPLRGQHYLPESLITVLQSKNAVAGAPLTT